MYVVGGQQSFEDLQPHGPQLPDGQYTSPQTACARPQTGRCWTQSTKTHLYAVCLCVRLSAKWFPLYI